MSKSFLQSSEWASFQKSLGRKVFFIENKLVIKYPMPMGLSFLYCPRVSFLNQKHFRKFTTEVKKIAKQENAVFLRIEPDVNSNLFNIKNSSKIKNSRLDARQVKFEVTHNIQPADTLILDLKESEKKILEKMHSKTRYNIRLAEKHKVEIVKTINPKDIDIFYNLALTTSRRDNFSYHEREYYKKMLKVLGQSGMIKLYLAYYGKTPLAANLVLFYQDTVIYLHGASDHNERKFMAPYLLQWQAIKDAKRKGYKTYDFWGIQPQDVTEEQKNKETEEQNRSLSFSVSQFPSSRPQWASWAGITRFKMGFAPLGEIIHYQPCQELIFQPFWYKLYKLTRRHK